MRNDRKRQQRKRKPPPAKKPPIVDEVPELYLGETAVLLATGPSLNDEQIEYIKPFHEQGLIRVFGLNDSYKICDFLDVFYACDPKWWDSNMDVIDHPCEQKWTQDKNWPKRNPGANVKIVSGGGGKGLSKRPHHIHYGSNSGFQLINLAWHYGIRKFILLGYNMDVPKGMKQHFFGVHPKPLNQRNNYKGFASQFATIEADDKNKIVNCTEPTALDCFRRNKLGEELPLAWLEEYKNGSRPEQTTVRQTDRTDIREPERNHSSHRPIIDESRY